MRRRPHRTTSLIVSLLLLCCAIVASTGDQAISPDGQFCATVRTFDVQLPPGDINVAGTTYNPCGHVDIVAQDGTTNHVRWVAESRGVEFDLNPVTAFSGSLVPRNLQWDSTQPYLYFEFAGGAAASGVWRVHATDSVPRYVGPTRESFRLMPMPDDPDWVACNQVRNGKWLYFAYTPEDIAQATHSFSTNAVAIVSNTFSDSRFAEQASTLSGFYSHVFDSWIYVNGDTPEALPKEQPMQGWEWLRIQHAGGDTLEFDLYVLGDNGHQGRVGGLARMTSPTRAEFTAPDGLPGKPRGKLVFEFDGDSVDITEAESCSYYRGARVVFDDTLERTEEHAIPTAAAP